MDKLREEMRELSDATCDLIDAFKKFSNTIDEMSAIDPVVKEIIGNSVKETMVKLMYGDDAYVGKRFPYRKYYPYGRDNVSYYRDFNDFKNNEEHIRKENLNKIYSVKNLYDEENEENV